jgi:hypothetical protein
MRFISYPNSHHWFGSQTPLSASCVALFCLLAFALCVEYAQSVPMARHFDHVGDPHRDSAAEMLASSATLHRTAVAVTKD